MIKKIILAALMVPLIALAQSYPSPKFGGFSFDTNAHAQSATGNLQYLQGAAGSASRSLTSKFQDVVSVLDFPGCDKTGSADSTTCIQTALNSGALSVYVPAGSYKQSGLTLPQTVGFTLFGDGPSSVLVQTAGSIHYPTIAGASNFDSHSTIRDLKFDGTAGTANTLDTSYAQTLDLLNLTFNNTPVGFASLFLNGNPGTSVYMHDVRARNIRVYSTTAGKSGIQLGGFTSDSSIDGYIGNGGFTNQYMLLADSGALTTTISNSHPYNASINVVKLSGNNNYFGWVNDTIDNANGDVFYSTGSTNGRFTNTYIEGIHSSQRGLVFDNSYNNSIDGLTCQTNGISNATSCVAEINGSSGNKVIGAQIDSLSNYATPYSVSGSGSYISGVQGYSSYASIYSFVGTVTAAQAQNTVTNLGVNGAQAGLGQTAFVVPLAGVVRSATIAVDSTPAAGQTFTFALQKNGSTIGTATISNGSFVATITLSPFVSVSVGDQISILSTFSATSGSASPRYSITLQG